jgi:hypothetical protein
LSDYELEPIIRKRHQFRKLALARERVKRLERELCGEPVKPEYPPLVPQCLRVQVGNEPTKSFDSGVPLVRAEAAALITRAMNSWRAPRPSCGLSPSFGARTVSRVYCETCNEETLHVLYTSAEFLGNRRPDRHSRASVESRESVPCGP